MKDEVKNMYDPSDLSKETISDLFFEQTKKLTWNTLRERRISAIIS